MPETDEVKDPMSSDDSDSDVTQTQNSLKDDVRKIQNSQEPLDHQTSSSSHRNICYQTH